MLYKGIELTKYDMYDIYYEYRKMCEKENILDCYDVTEEQADEIAEKVLELKDETVEWSMYDFYKEAAESCNIKLKEREDLKKC